MGDSGQEFANLWVDGPTATNTFVSPMGARFTTDTPLPAEKCQRPVSRDLPPGRLVRFSGRPSEFDGSDGFELRSTPRQEALSYTPGYSPIFWELRTGALRQLTNHGVGGTRRAGEIAFGFPITGPLSHLYTFEGERFRTRDPLCAAVWGGFRSFSRSIRQPGEMRMFYGSNLPVSRKTDG